MRIWRRGDGKVGGTRGEMMEKKEESEMERSGEERTGKEMGKLVGGEERETK